MEIFWHGYVAGACSIVPVNGESAEKGTGPVYGYGVEVLDGLDEVVGVLFSDVLDAKVVNNIPIAGVLGTGTKPNWAR